MAPCPRIAAQSSDSSSQDTTHKPGHKTATSTTHKKTASSAHHRKKVTAARAHKMKRVFVASSDLRPMARQLIELRTPAAYTGVENYAHSHAGTEPGALAWFAIGYAHYLDGHYPLAITALQKAQPQIGELGDYVAFFIGNSYVLSNNAEESLAYLREFGTRFPDSLYSHDATIAYARALLALNRPNDAIKLLEAHRSPASAETEYYLGKAYIQSGQGRTGGDVLQRVYYEYATSYVADQAFADLGRLPERNALAPVTYSEHLHRADALYKARRYGPAINEYQYVVDFAPPGQQSEGLIQLANSYVKDGKQGARNTGAYPRRRQRSQRREVVSAGGAGPRGERRRVAQQHTGAHARVDAEVAVAGVGAAHRGQHVPAAQGLRPRPRLLPRTARAISGGQQGGVRALEVRVADVSPESPRPGQEVLRGAGRVLSGDE